MLHYIVFLFDIVHREPIQYWLPNLISWIRATSPRDVAGYQWGDCLNW